VFQGSHRLASQLNFSSRIKLNRNFCWCRWRAYTNLNTICSEQRKIEIIISGAENGIDNKIKIPFTLHPTCFVGSTIRLYCTNFFALLLWKEIRLRHGHSIRMTRKILQPYAATSESSTADLCPCNFPITQRRIGG